MRMKRSSTERKVRLFSIRGFVILSCLLSCIWLAWKNGAMQGGQAKEIPHDGAVDPHLNHAASADRVVEQDQEGRSKFDLSGVFVSRSPSCRMLVKGDGSLYEIVIDYNKDLGHPTYFQVDLSNPFFEYGGRFYRFDFEGRDGAGVSQIFLIWRDSKLEQFHSQIVFLKQTSNIQPKAR
jgi:hypothetical protein